MSPLKLTWHNCVYLLSILFFLNSCDSQKKTAPKVYAVEIIQMQFQPAELRVQKGDTVVFINKDFVPHDVTEINKKWASTELTTGKSWKMVAGQSWDYYCSIHLVMKGKIVVQ